MIDNQNILIFIDKDISYEIIRRNIKIETKNT